MTMQQPEALRLADIVERLNVGVHSQAIAEEYSAAARELRRLHAENQDLRTRHYCNTAEIEALQNRVQELGEMARENRSKRVIELERRIAEMEEQMAAIGAGGVEPLRKRGLDAETRRHAAMGKAIERACADLPEETEIIVSLEKGAGTVTLIDTTAIHQRRKEGKWLDGKQHPSSQSQRVVYLGHAARSPST